MATKELDQFDSQHGTSSAIPMDVSFGNESEQMSEDEEVLVLISKKKMVRWPLITSMIGKEGKEDSRR